MARIEFDRARREALARLLAPLDGQRLIDLLSETLGPAWYNQGLRDAQAAMQAKVDDIAEAIAGLEQPEPR